MVAELLVLLLWAVAAVEAFGPGPAPPCQPFQHQPRVTPRAATLLMRTRDDPVHRAAPPDTGWRGTDITFRKGMAVLTALVVGGWGVPPMAHAISDRAHESSGAQETQLVHAAAAGTGSAASAEPAARSYRSHLPSVVSWNTVSHRIEEGGGDEAAGSRVAMTETDRRSTSHIHIDVGDIEMLRDIDRDRRMAPWRRLALFLVSSGTHPHHLALLFVVRALSLPGARRTLCPCCFPHRHPCIPTINVCMEGGVGGWVFAA